jgi:hypothetical protein
MVRIDARAGQSDAQPLFDVELKQESEWYRDASLDRVSGPARLLPIMRSSAGRVGRPAGSFHSRVSGDGRADRIGELFLRDFGERGADFGDHGVRAFLAVPKSAILKEEAKAKRKKRAKKAS